MGFKPITREVPKSHEDEIIHHTLYAGWLTIDGAEISTYYCFTLISETERVNLLFSTSGWCENKYIPSDNLEIQKYNIEEYMYSGEIQK